MNTENSYTYHLNLESLSESHPAPENCPKETLFLYYIGLYFQLLTSGKVAERSAIVVPPELIKHLGEMISDLATGKTPCFTEVTRKLEKALISTIPKMVTSGLREKVGSKYYIGNLTSEKESWCSDVDGVDHFSDPMPDLDSLYEIVRNGLIAGILHTPGPETTKEEIYVDATSILDMLVEAARSSIGIKR